MPLVISLAAGVLLLIIIVVVIAAAGGKKPASKQTSTTQNSTTNSDQLTQKASSLDLQQINNAMSQQISGLDNNKDFSADQLSDKTLGIGQ
jgi:hypothetical protein